MGVVIKQSFWGSAMAYLGVFLGFFNTIVLRPAYLDLEQIGLLNVVISNALLFTPFATLGMPATYVRYFPYLREDTKLDQQFFSLQLFLVLVTCLLFGLFTLLGFDWIKTYYSGESSIYHEYILTTFIIFVFHSLYLHISAFSRVKLDIITPYALKEVQLRIGNMVLITLYALNWINFEWSAKLLVVNYMIAFGFNLAHVVMSHNLRFTFSFLSLPKVWIKKMYHFGGYNLLLAGSISIFSNIGFLMLPAIVGLEANGIYSICFYIGIIIEMPKRSMAQIISPIFASEFKKNNLQGIEDLYRKSSITLSVISTLFFIGVLCNLNDLFTLIPRGNELSTGFYVVLGIALTKQIDLLFGFNSEILVYSKYYKYNLYFLLGTAAVTVILNYLLMNSLGINGAALAFLISSLLFNAVKHYFVKQKLGLSPFTKSHITLTMIGMLMGSLFWVLPLTNSSLINIPLRSVLITVTYVLVVYKLNISEDINNLTRNVAKKILKINL